MLIKSIILDRKQKGNQDSLFGILTIKTLNHGSFLFSTCESLSHHITPGTYNLHYAFSTKFKRELLTIMGVPGRTGIRFHPGNRGTDFKGCIGIGHFSPDIYTEIPKQIYYSKKSLDLLETMLWKDHKHTITINPIQ